MGDLGVGERITLKLGILWDKLNWIGMDYNIKPYQGRH
jgi:hypothetical protein